MPDRTRRALLAAVAGLGTSLAGCSESDGAVVDTDTPPPTTTTTTATNTSTTTTGRTTTGPNTGATLEAFSTFNLAVIPDPTAMDEHPDAVLSARVHDPEGVSAVEFVRDPEAAAETLGTHTLDTPRATVGVEVRVEPTYFPPGETTIGVGVTDTADTTTWVHRELSLPDAAYRIDLRDETTGIGRIDHTYRTDRTWDDATNRTTPEEWLTSEDSIYWNALTVAEAQLPGSFHDLLYSNAPTRVGAIHDDPQQYRDRSTRDILERDHYIPRDLENVGTSVEDKIEAIVQGVGLYLEDRGHATSEGSAVPYVAAERYVARAKLGWETDTFFVTAIGGTSLTSASHEIVLLAFEADDEWHLRYHAPRWKTTTIDLEAWSDGDFYGLPEQTDYRDPSASHGTVDAFNMDTLGFQANATIAPATPEDIHSQPASSLSRLADTTGTDLETGDLTRRTVFERSFLESLQEATRDDGFARRLLENTIHNGRALLTVYNASADDDYIGVGGRIGDEKFYRLEQGTPPGVALR